MSSIPLLHSWVARSVALLRRNARLYRRVVALIRTTYNDIQWRLLRDTSSDVAKSLQESSDVLISTVFQSPAIVRKTCIANLTPAWQHLRMAPRVSNIEALNTLSPKAAFPFSSIQASNIWTPLRSRTIGEGSTTWI